MMKSTRIILAGLVCLFTYALVAPAGITGSVPTPEEVNINWRQFEGKTVRALFVAHPWQEGIDPYIEEFEQLTGINMEVAVISEDLFWDKVVIGLSAASPPFDVFFVSGGADVYSYYLNNWIEPLDQYIDDPTLTDKDWYDLDDFSSGYIQGFRIPTAESPLYSIPITSEVYIIFYRKDVFAEQGIDVNELKNIDDWLDVVKKLTAETDLYGTVVRGGAVGITDELMAMAFDYWGDLPHETGKAAFFGASWVPRFTHPRIVQAFATWAELMKNSPPGVTAFTWYDASTAFAQGLAATFWFDASLFAPSFEDPEESAVAGNVGYAVVPPTTYGHATAFWAWGIGITSKADPNVKKAAWLFIEWASSKYGEKFVAPNTWGAVRKSTWELPEMKQILPTEYVDTVSRSLEIAKYPALYFPGAQEVIQKALDALHAIYLGTPPEEAMATLQRQAIEIVEEAGLVPEGLGY